jgi:hypothetical protein
MFSRLAVNEDMLGAEKSCRRRVVYSEISLEMRCVATKLNIYLICCLLEGFAKSDSARVLLSTSSSIALNNRRSLTYHGSLSRIVNVLGDSDRLTFEPMASRKDNHQEVDHFGRRTNLFPTFHSIILIASLILSRVSLPYSDMIWQSSDELKKG